MKSYSNKSNAKRAAVRMLIKTNKLSEAEAKENLDQHFIIEEMADGWIVSDKGASIITNTGLKIEKDRPEQNGIIRPSIGGKCRAIWDECDNIHAKGKIPMPTQMKQIAEEKGWNVNNAVIEMYQWRRFNGLTGRQK